MEARAVRRDEPPLDRVGFLALYPWPAGMVAGRRAIEWLAHVDLPAPPDAVWPLIADQSRFGRVFGASRMSFEEKDGQLHGRASYGGLPHEWIERPWQWIAGRELGFVRDYLRGPPVTLRCISRLEALSGERTRLYVYYGFVPRSPLARLAVRVWLHGFQRSYLAGFDELRRALGQPAAPAFHAAPAPLAAEAQARLRRGRDELVGRGVAADDADRLVGYLAEADDLDAYRIQVRRLARQWQRPERSVLEGFLHATRAGLCEMSWDVICPHCRGVRHEAATLAEVDERGRCDVCQIDFATSAENALEITFHIHPAIRKVDKVFYCSAEPAKKQHIQVQQVLAAGERREVATALLPGRYRVRARGREEHGELEIGAGPTRHAVDLGAPLGAVRLAAAPALTLVNSTDRPVTVVIEEPSWAGDALRPAHLFGLQAFRDLFGEAYLAAGVQLHIGQQTVLFTDIVGSTRYYHEVGDPAAFVAVKRHFEAVFEVVRRRGGGVVKTVGDAVMAAFADPGDALSAALDIQRAMHGGDDAPARVRLRVSLNLGACIAVNLNSGIDYFGGAVNTAAKLQRCAGAGEIALGEAVHRATADRIAAFGLAVRETVLEHEALGALKVFVLAPGRAS